jgi:hypothetical protein
MPTKRCLHTINELSHFLIVIGGYTDFSIVTCDLYNPKINEWMPFPSLNKKRHRHSVCIISNRFIYAIGGKE